MTNLVFMYKFKKPGKFHLSFLHRGETKRYFVQFTVETDRGKNLEVEFDPTQEQLVLRNKLFKLIDCTIQVK